MLVAALCICLGVLYLQLLFLLRSAVCCDVGHPSTSGCPLHCRLASQLCVLRAGSSPLQTLPPRSGAFVVTFALALLVCLFGLLLQAAPFVCAGS